jgi:hypothetical protein
MTQVQMETIGLNTAELTYNLLLSQIKIHRELSPLDADKEQLLKEAEHYALQKDYDIAIVYLEETLVAINQPQNPLKNSFLNTTKSGFAISFLSGVDFNRQEFEIGYLQSDSTVLEEISKPYIGLRSDYYAPTGAESYFEVSNSLRYDRENWRDDYRIGWRQGNQFSIYYNGYWNDSDDLSSNSFWEHELETRMGSDWFGSFNWAARNTYNIKNYRNSNIYISDYFRNRFNFLAEWELKHNQSLSAEIAHELNESLGRDDNDYSQGILRTAFLRDAVNAFNYFLSPELTMRDYKLEFEDSTISNRFTQLGMEVLFEMPIFQALRFEIDDDFYYKRYKKKSSLEPDYLLNVLRGNMIFELSSVVEVGFGYEWELKKHDQQSDSESDVTEQNFNSHGITAMINYFSLNGTYLSSSLSYHWRRYPPSVTNDLFSIYSDRDVFSIMLMAFVPISNHFSLNGFLTYDNDIDKDLDQQNNQSTIFTMELEYKF